MTNEIYIKKANDLSKNCINVNNLFIKIILIRIWVSEILSTGFHIECLENSLLPL